MKKTKLSILVTLLCTQSLYADELDLGNIVVRNNQMPISACVAVNNFDDSSAFLKYLSLYRNNKEERLNLLLNNNKLCFFDLKNSSNYKIVFKKGLKDNKGNVLSANKEYSFKTLEAAPYIKGEKNIILPLSDKRPYLNLRSMNIDNVDLVLYKINTNNLDSLYYPSLKNIDKYDLESLKTDNAYKVLQKNINLKQEKDKESVNKIYLKDLLGSDFASGIYIANFKYQDLNKDLNLNQAIIISNLGVSAYLGKDKIASSVRSFSDGKALKDVELTLIAKNNDILEVVKTNKDGFASFKNKYLKETDSSLQPNYILARYKDDIYALNLYSSILNYADTEGINNGSNYYYLYKDRGIYRPNETVHLNTIVRDSDLSAIDNNDTLIYDFMLPNSNIKYKSIEVKKDKFGGFNVDLKLPKQGGYGNWTVYVSKDGINKKASTTFNVSDFIPEQIKIRDSALNQEILANLRNKLLIETVFNYGQKADNLPYDATLSIVKAPIENSSYQDYSFGLVKNESRYFKMYTGRSNEDGIIKIEDFVPDIKEPSHLVLDLKVIDTQNQSINYAKKYYINSPKYFLGLKKSTDNKTVSFDVVSINSKGEIKESDIEYKLYKLRYIYQTQYVNNSWTYNRFEDKVLIDSNKAHIDLSKKNDLKFNLDDGEYELVINNEDSKASTRFYKGYSIADNNLSLERFDLIADKESYKENEDINLSFYSDFDGYASIIEGSNNIEAMHDLKIKKGLNKIKIKAKKEYFPGFYVIVNTYKAINNKQSAAVRSYGLNYIKINADALKLNVSSNLDNIDKIKVNEKLKLEFNLDSKEDAKATLALVDVGILALTNFKALSPYDYFTQKRALSVDSIDNYAYLINRVLELKQGYGDEASALTGLVATPSKSIVLYKKDVNFKDGKALVELPIPTFQGALALNLSVYNDKKLGSYQKELLVYDDAVSTLSLPRFLTLGDKSTARLSLHNINVENSKFKVSLKCSDNLKCNVAQDTFTIAKGKREDLFFEIEALDYGVSNINIEVSSDNYKYNESFEMAIREAYSPSFVTEIVKVPAKERLELTLLNEYKDDVKAYYTLSPLPFANKKALVEKLYDNNLYYSNLNSNSSYVNALMSLDDSDVENRSEKINDILSLLITMQKATGSFLSNYNSWYDNNYDSVHAVDTLLKARDKKFFYNEDAIKLSIKSLLDIASFYDALASKAYAFELLSMLSNSKNADIINFADEIIRSNNQNILLNIHLARALYNINEKDYAKKMLQRAFTFLQRSKELQDNLYTNINMSFSEYLAIKREIYEFENTSVANLVHDSFKLVEALNYCDYKDLSTDVFNFIKTLQVDSQYMTNSTIEAILLALESTKSSYKESLEKAVTKDKAFILNKEREDLFASLSIFGHKNVAPNTYDKGFKVQKLLLDENLNEFAEDVTVPLNKSMYVVINLNATKFNDRDVFVKDLLIAGFEYERVDNNSEIFKKAQEKYNVKPSYDYKVAHSNDKVLFTLPAFRDTNVALIYKLRASVKGTYQNPAVSAYVVDGSNLSGLYKDSRLIKIK